MRNQPEFAIGTPVRWFTPPMIEPTNGHIERVDYVKFTGWKYTIRFDGGRTMDDQNVGVVGRMVRKFQEWKKEAKNVIQ